MLRPDIMLLCLAYVLSQFFRAFLAVLTEVLERDVGATSSDLALASGTWFLVFAIMQIPVGAALDRLGPRRTSSVLLFLGGCGGALLFAAATEPWHITVAMGLIGVGCSPVLMASYFIFARAFPAAKFATLAALILGIGSVGNLIAAYPTAWAAETIGWRMTLTGLAVVAGAIAVGLAFVVRDPPKFETSQRGSVLDVLRIPALWLIIPLMIVNYAPSATIRGLWIGPYLRDVFGMETSAVGAATLVMGIAMICGTLIYGPLDRIFGTRKWVIFPGAALSGVFTLGLALWTDHSAWLAIAMMAMVGMLGASFPILIAHGRSFIPEHLTGRGVTLLNLFGIGGAGALQSVSGSVRELAPGADPVAGYSVLFGFFALLTILGLAAYAFSTDRTG